MEMWKDKRNIQLAIGLVTFGLAMATNALPCRWNRYLDGMRQAQFVGTLALLFGLLRAHPRHKDKLLLVWLGTSVFCCLSMGYAGLMLWVREGIFSASIFPWSMTVAVAYMLDYMYGEYVALTVGAEEATPLAAGGETAGEVKSETKPIQSPPNGFNYRTENPTILVHGKSIQLP